MMDLGGVVVVVAVVEAVTVGGNDGAEDDHPSYHGPDRIRGPGLVPLRHHHHVDVGGMVAVVVAVMVMVDGCPGVVATVEVVAGAVPGLVRGLRRHHHLEGVETVAVTAEDQAVVARVVTLQQE